MSSAAVPSTLALFDDIRCCMQVLADGIAEEEFLRILGIQDKFRVECSNRALDAQRIQKELDASLQNIADLETKLLHARRFLETESKARRDAENERDQLEKKLVSVANLLKHEGYIKDDKLSFLSKLTRKRKSIHSHIDESDINSTSSFLSDLSAIQSVADFSNIRLSQNWQKHRPSLSKNTVPCIGNKRSRLSGGGDVGVRAHLTAIQQQSIRRSGIMKRRSSTGVIKHNLDIGPAEKGCSTSKMMRIPNNLSDLPAESTIDSMPIKTVAALSQNIESQCIEDGEISTPKCSPFKQVTALQMTPNVAMTSAHIDSPPHILCSTLVHQHNFAPKTFIRVGTCIQCQMNIRFGSVGLRCRDCPIRCHVECRYLLTVACIPQTDTHAIKLLMGYITDHAPTTPPLVPALVVHCVREIEARGLNEVGIYRVSGSEREVKSLKERFLCGAESPNLSNIDVHVLCGCVKDFLCSLREQLIPTSLWKDFSNAVQNPSTEEEIQKDLFEAIDELPQANRDTLAFLILHFQRIAECPEVRMPIDNISRVFGPTIVGYSSPDPDKHALFTEVFTQFSILQHLIKIPADYWMQFVALDMDKENKRDAGEEPMLSTSLSHNNNN